MLVADRIESFAEYSQFKSLKDFNNNIEMFLAVHKDEFTKTEQMLFKRLTKYCAKVKGVANASIKKILEGVKEKDFKLGASESTFQRMKRKAIRLGILEVRPVQRQNGSQSSNLWIFKRFQNNDTPKTEGEQVKPLKQKGKVVRQLTPLKTGIPLTKTNKQNTYKRNGDAPHLDHSFVPAYVPKEFVQAVKPFYDDADTIVKLWQLSSAATRKIAGLRFPSVAIDQIIAAFKETVFMKKADKIKESFSKCFYGVLINVLKEHVKELNLEYMRKKNPFYYDWMEV